MSPTVQEKRRSSLSVSGKFFRKDGVKVFVKAVTYGPFRSNSEGYPLPESERLEEDLERIQSLGFNAVRVYHEIPREFLDHCTRCGLDVFVSIPWPNHSDFLQSNEARDESEQIVRETIRHHEGHPAIAAYFMGNETPAAMVRWLGAARVKRWIEHLIDLGRAEDPDVLFAYSNFPSTEYLNPANADFLAYNIYLENRDAFRRYLARIQNIAGDLPLMVTEFGVDSRSLGEESQREMQLWHLEETLRSGLAGTTVYSFTDEWFNRGRDETEWNFGITRTDRSEKPVCGALEKLLPGIRRPRHGFLPSRLPSIAVIVCTYNGSRLLRDCLEALDRLQYPDHELIVIDDGSNEETKDILREAPSSVRVIHQEHAGLSVARNRGAAETRADILAYTDDDCIVDEDWLYFLAEVFSSGEYAAVGGPNIPPRPRNLTEACVASAPGGPSHVLLSDTEAEHIPGCNLAVTREAFDAICGFIPEYTAAGDDVDFCWRLQDQGFHIGFSPSAVVWHHRRFLVRDFVRQQYGYGKAEAILISRHATKFGLLGGARWTGALYGNARGGGLGFAPRIYQGVFGSAPFQVIYENGHSDLTLVVTSFQWVALTVVVAGFSFLLPWLGFVAFAMFALTCLPALAATLRARIGWGFDSLRARALLFFLTLAQPVIRGFARFRGSLKHGTLPSGVSFSGRILWLPSFPNLLPRRLFRFFSRDGKTRDDLLRQLPIELADAGLPVRPNHPWESWDLEIGGQSTMVFRISTVTEYGDRPEHLTRARISTHFTILNKSLHLVFLVTFLVALALYTMDLARWVLAAYGILWVGLFFIRGLAIRRISRLLRTCANSIGMEEPTA